MKLTVADKLLLKTLLSNVVLYKETYEEVYDHVLTGLEECTDVTNIHKEAHRILEEDFGGYRGIAQMESFRKNYVEAEFYVNYLAILKAYVRSPLILILLTGCAIGYYLMGNVYRQNSVMLTIISVLISASPIMIFLISKQIRVATQNGLKDSITVPALNSGKIMVPVVALMSSIILSSFAREYCWNHGWRMAERLIDGVNAIAFVGMLLNLVIFIRTYYSPSKKNSFN